MRSPGKTVSSLDAKAQLEAFIVRYDPAIAKQAKAILVRMRRLLPGTNMLVWDNYNALAIGFGTGTRASDCWFSIAIYPRWVSLFFFGTLPLKDPRKRLKGSGRTTRHIVLTKGAATLDEPDVAALIDQALEKAGRPFTGGRGVVLIKSISAKQRPRRASPDVMPSFA